jgi:hypothetical protein
MAKFTFDNVVAYSEGWGLFTCDVGLRILRLDDPQSVDESYPANPQFKSDEAALAFVRRKAKASVYRAYPVDTHRH